MDDGSVDARWAETTSPTGSPSVVSPFRIEAARAWPVRGLSSLRAVERAGHLGDRLPGPVGVARGALIEKDDLSASDPSVAVVLPGNVAPRPLVLSGWNGVCARGERSRKDQRGGSEPAQQAAAFERMALIVTLGTCGTYHGKRHPFELT